MSSGVFQIVSNTGRSEKLLMATDYLENRIRFLIKNRDPKITEQILLTLPENDKYLNVSNSILPSFIEIEKSHNTFINSAYKPHIPLATEYIKTSYSNPKFGESVTLNLPTIGNWTSDCCLSIRLSGLKAIDPRDRVRYVAMLGHRLIKRVQLLVNNTSIIDEYDTDNYNAYYQFEVKPDERIGYLRNIGQETSNEAFLTGDPSTDTFKEGKIIYDGNQTLKYQHDSIDLFIPLIFWFNKDTINALPSLNWGLLQIRVEFAESTDIIGFYNGGGGGLYIPPNIDFCDLYCNQIFVPNDIFSLFSKKYTFSIFRAHRSHKEVIKVQSSQEYEIKLKNLKWATELVYISFRPRENLNLSQSWYKNTKLVRKYYKFPVVAKNPADVITGTIISMPDFNQIEITTASLMSLVDDTYVGYDLIITGGTGFDYTLQNNNYVISNYEATNKIITVTMPFYRKYDATTTFEIFTPQLAINKVEYYKEEPVIDSMALHVNAIDVFKDNNEMFYNSYLPLNFDKLNTPIDRGSYLISFCLRPLHHDPSGSINISMNPETYLKFKSSKITVDYPVDLIVLSRAINFLLIDSASGGISMKYTI